MSDAWVSSPSSVTTHYLNYDLSYVSINILFYLYAPLAASTKVPNRSQNQRSLQPVGWGWRWAPPADHSYTLPTLCPQEVTEAWFFKNVATVIKAIYLLLLWDSSTFVAKVMHFFYIPWHDYNGPAIMKMRLLSTAMEMLIVEKQDKEKERERVLSERIPPIKLSGLSVQELQVQSNQLHWSYKHYLYNLKG